MSTMLTFEMAYSIIYSSSILGLIFGYLNYYSVVSINVTSEGKPELKEYLLKDSDVEKDEVPRSKNLVESLHGIANAIEEVISLILL